MEKDAKRVKWDQEIVEKENQQITANNLKG